MGKSCINIGPNLTQIDVSNGFWMFFWHLFDHFDRGAMASKLRLRHTQLLLRGGARTPLEALEQHGENRNVVWSRMVLKDG